MPINTRAFTGRDQTGCNCYKCRTKRELEGFDTWYRSLGDQFGGTVPRSYIVPTSPSVTLEQAESIKYAVNQMLAHNSSKIEALRPTQIAKHAYCVDCGKYHLKDPGRKTPHNGVLMPLCSECSRLFYRLCSHCHVYKKKSDSKRCGDSYYCTDCFFSKFYMCNRCDRIFTLGDEHRFIFSNVRGLANAYTICPECKLSLHNCTTCGHHFFDSPRATADRRGMCPSCFSDTSEIKQYSYKPVALWKTNIKTERFRGDTLFAGFEWELENRSGRDSTDTPKLNNESQAERISSLMGDGFVYFKRDGSLSNGFEVVTHPFSWKFYHDNREKFKNMVHEAYKNGMRAERTCGFHVHLSKRAFSYGQLYKFVKIIYSPANAEFIDIISERPARTSYAAFREADQKKPAKFAKKKSNYSEDRHSAVNATGPNTVEIRFFASTTNVLSLLKNLEFVFALHEYTGACSYKQYDASDFLAWLATRSMANKYRNLATWIKNSNIPDSMRRKFRKQLKKNKANLNLKKGA